LPETKSPLAATVRGLFSFFFKASRAAAGPCIREKRAQESARGPDAAIMLSTYCNKKHKKQM